MSKSLVEERYPPGTKLVSRNVDAPAPLLSDIGVIQFGYIIGIKANGDLVFHMLGSKPHKLSDMLGLHTIAGRYLDGLIASSLYRSSCDFNFIEELTEPGDA